MRTYYILFLLLLSCSTAREGTRKYYVLKKKHYYNLNEKVILEVSNRFINQNEIKKQKKIILLAAIETEAFGLMREIELSEGLNNDSLINKINKEPIYVYVSKCPEYGIFVYYTPFGEVIFVQKAHYDSTYSEYFYPPNWE